MKLLRCFFVIVTKVVVSLKKIIGPFIFILIFLSVPAVTLAVDYSIVDMNIDVQLNDQGDAFVTEIQTYHFDSSFNGITRSLLAKEGTRLVDYEAKEEGESLQVEFEEGTYKVYRAGESGETVTIVSSYTIKDAVELYDDAGQFYWSFFDQNNPSSYKNLDIFIRPPAEAADTLSIGYDEAADKDSLEEDGSVHYAIGQLPSESFADVRVAFDHELFTDVKRVEEGSVKTEILTALENRVKEQKAFEIHQKRLTNSVLYVLGGFALVLVFIYIFTKQRERAILLEMKRSYTDAYLAPEEIMSIPATLLYNSGIYLYHAELLSVALLDLVRQGCITQTAEDSFKVLHKNAKNEHEEYLIDWLFYKIGKEGIFTTEDLKNYANNKLSASSYHTEYQEWQKLVKEEVKSHHLRKNVLNFKIGLGIMAILLIGVGIHYIVYDLMLPMWGAFLLALFYAVFAMFYRPKTVKGKKIERDWKQFLQKYVRFEDEDWNSLQDDEQRRAFLYSAGTKQHQIRVKNDEFLNREPQKSYDVTDPMYFLLFATMFNGHFDSAHTSAAEITSAGSSSTSTFTGGGGIGGSGGGSGAF